MTRLNRIAAGYRISTYCWMICLCALLGTLWALNIAPRTPLSYQTRSLLVMSNNRLEALLHRLKETDYRTEDTNAPESVAVLSLKKAGKRPDSFAIATPSQDDLPVLNIIELRSDWKQPLDLKDLQLWITNVSHPVSATQQELELQRTARWLQWKLKTTEHYESTSIQYEGKNVQSATYDSSTRNDTQVTTASAQAISPDVKHQIIKQLETVSARLKSEKATKQGQVTLQSSTAWHPVVKSAPILVPLCGLFLGALAGVALCLLLQPTKSKPTPSLTQYQNILADKGIPLLTITGSSSFIPRSTTSSLFRKIGSANRLQWWMAGCEWSLLIWCICIGARFLADPLWRSLAVHQPLAALATLFSSIS